MVNDAGTAEAVNVYEAKGESEQSEHFPIYEATLV